MDSSTSYTGVTKLELLNLHVQSQTSSAGPVITGPAGLLAAVIPCSNAYTLFSCADQDFEGIIDGEIVFFAGEVSVSFDISITDDSILEDLERFTVEVSSTEPNIMIQQTASIATVSIIDTDRKSIVDVHVVCVCG